ncbi:hypothetical protein ACE103_31300 [Bradyrhizobium sp. ma5]|uniref:hypothetical protein n=1 Tax=Bradyrhizobium sp. ma5 TaxID=3344828 RepID=UPI0035D3F07E
MIKDSSTHFDRLISAGFNHAVEPGTAIFAIASILLCQQPSRMLCVTTLQSEVIATALS